MNVKRFLSFIDNYIFDFFFPKICLICGEKILLNENFLVNRKNNSEFYNNFNQNYNFDKKHKNINNYNNSFLKSTEYCCYKCKSKLEFAPPKEEIFNNLIINFSHDLAISNAISLFAKTDEIPVMNLIYKLKYGGFTRIGTEYGEQLGKILVMEGLKNYDFIVPVPLHHARKRERGYNQSDYIARGVNKILNSTVACDLLKKTKSTISQTQLKSAERKKNLQNVFEFNKFYSVSGKKILLVDDVLTTGVTVNNCSAILLANKAVTVDVATLIKV